MIRLRVVSVAAAALAAAAPAAIGATWGPTQYFPDPARSTIDVTGASLTDRGQALVSGFRKGTFQPVVRQRLGFKRPWSAWLPVGTDAGVNAGPVADLNAAGRGVLAYVSGSGAVMVMRRLPNGVWQGAGPVTGSASANRVRALRLGDDGTVRVVWDEGAEAAPKALRSASQPAGGAWSAVAPGPTLPATGGTVALSPAGHAVAVWADAGRALASRQLAGGAWDPAAELAASGASGATSAAVNAAGEAAVAWGQGSGAATDVRVAVRPAAAAAFGAAEDPTPAGGAPLESQPSVAVSDTGEVVLAMSKVAADFSGDAVAIHRAPAGTWGTPVSIGKVGAEDSGVTAEVAAAAGGAWVATVDRHFGPGANAFDVFTTRNPAGGTWTDTGFAKARRSGYGPEASAVAPNGAVLHVYSADLPGTTFQSYDGHRVGAAPTVRTIRISRRERRVTVAFVLNGAATVSGGVTRSGGTSTATVGPRALRKGARSLRTGARLPAGTYAVRLRACDAVKGCSERTVTLTTR